MKPAEEIHEPKPVLLVACLCDNVIIEKDGTVSVIRMVDSVTLMIPKPDAMPEDFVKSFPPEVAAKLMTAAPLIQLKLLICVKAGEYSGTVSLKTRLITTSGKVRDFQPIGESVELKEPNAGLNAIMDLRLLVRRVGLCWIEVFVNEEIRSRIPLLIQLGEGSAPLPELPENE